MRIHFTAFTFPTNSSGSHVPVSCEKAVTSFLPELDQLTDQSNQLTDQPTDQLTNLRDTELRLLLATEKNLPFQIAVDMDRLEEMQLTSS